jgi:hypothetical protein
MKSLLMFVLLGFFFMSYSPAAEARAIPRHAHHQHHHSR